MAIEEIHPRWVVVKDQIRKVSDFSHLRPHSRPEAICPVCMNPVIMKLGNERVHHYAHQPDVKCPATQPETALHLNTKFYIFKQLLSGNQLYLEQHCSNGCGKSRNISWVKDWERIERESTIGTFRPDILIVASGETNKAIEIKVTHPIEGDKEAFYKEQNIGWLEVEALESIYDGENAWTIDQPLPFAVCKPPLPEWTCYRCQAELRREKEAELREQRRKEYRERNKEEVIFSYMVDIYYPSGRKIRTGYYLKKVIRNDEPVGVRVEKEKWDKDLQQNKYEVVFQQNGEINEVLLELAQRTPKIEVEKARSNGAIIVEWEWLPWVPDKKYHPTAFERYPLLYEWDEGVRKWVKREQQKLDSAHPKETRILPQDTIIITMQEGVCIHCGQTTTDYWYFDSATRECKCRKCYREGKY